LLKEDNMTLTSQTVAVSCVGCLSAFAFDTLKNSFSKTRKQKQADSGEPSESRARTKVTNDDDGHMLKMDTMEGGSCDDLKCGDFRIEAIPMAEGPLDASLCRAFQTELTISTEDMLKQLEKEAEFTEVNEAAKAKERVHTSKDSARNALIGRSSFGRSEEDEEDEAAEAKEWVGKVHTSKDSARSALIGRLTQKGGSLQDILAARRATFDEDEDDAVGFNDKVRSSVPAIVGKLQAKESHDLQSILKSRRAISDTTCESFQGDNDTLVSSGAVSQESAEADLPIALLFPNQGSEVVGMLQDALSFPKAAALLNKAQAVLGFDLAKICSDHEFLKLPKHSHSALYVAELVAVERLRSQQPQAVERCSAVAGVGLGEFAALVVAGVLDFEQGLKLVQIRAETMHAAAEKATGRISMLCIVAIPTPRVRELCKEALIATGDGICEIVSVLMPDTCTCAGSEKAIAWLKVIAERSSSTSRKVSAKFLAPVNGQEVFQTSAMMSARDRLHSALSEVSLRPPRCSIYFNSTGRSLPAGSDPGQVIELIAAQLASTILWVPAIEQMIEDGIEDFFELGPGRKLRTIMQRINSEKWRRTKCISPCGPWSLPSEACGGA
jgi:[acyl-carrier-protein] S-malonyltransferase